ncbi:MAG: enoyl-CoA hydratase/isomerase family protein [Acidimicrobiia bacterium]
MANLIVERSEGVVRLTLNRPERLNAVTSDMWDELTEVFSEVTYRSEDRVLVITGAGKGFCSGADLSTGGGGARSVGRAFEGMRKLGRCAVMLHDIPKPTIAAVNGVAVGAGCNLALGCDLIIASDAARFSEIFVRRGLSIDFGGSYLLPRLVGLHKAKELALLADVISAEEAQRIGIVNRVVPAAELDQAVDEVVAKLLQTAPLALAQTKALLDRGLTRSIGEAVEAEAIAQVVNGGTKDAAEAISAFAEKRDPTFTGE